MGTENALPLGTELLAQPVCATGSGLGHLHGLLRDVLRTKGPEILLSASSQNLKHSEVLIFPTLTSIARGLGPPGLS